MRFWSVLAVICFLCVGFGSGSVFPVPSEPAIDIAFVSDVMAFTPADFPFHRGSA